MDNSRVVKTIATVTNRIIDRSQAGRSDYLDKVSAAHQRGVSRTQLSCGNVAHAYAASEKQDKSVLAVDRAANLAIISSYNDMLSAHQPFKDYPEIIKQAARDAGARSHAGLDRASSLPVLFLDFTAEDFDVVGSSLLPLSLEDRRYR